MIETNSEGKPFSPMFFAIVGFLIGSMAVFIVYESLRRTSYRNLNEILNTAYSDGVNDCLEGQVGSKTYIYRPK